MTVAIHPGYEEDSKPKTDDDKIANEIKAMAEDSGVQMEELTRLNRLITTVTEKIE